MKPTKKRTAKTRNPIVGKLLDLKYRINDSYRGGKRSESAYNDKTWVMDKIKYLRYGDGNVNKLTKVDMLRCNEMWNKYEGK